MPLHCPCHCVHLFIVVWQWSGGEGGDEQQTHLTALGYPSTRQSTRGYGSGASRRGQQEVMVLVGINKILILKEKYTISPKANAFGLSFGLARESPQHPNLSISGVVEGGAWGEEEHHS